MNKNKVIGNLYKKLLLNDFIHDDIRKLLFCFDEFNSFNNFIFHLFKIANTKNDSLQYKMCNSILSYLQFLVIENNIEDFDLDILEIDNFYHPIEIDALKNSINILSINENTYDIYKDVIFIYKIIPLEKEVYIFINNQYKGIYKSTKHINYFVKDRQIISTLFLNTSNIAEYRWQEINNFIISRYWDSLNLFKNNIIALLNKNKIIDNNIYDNIHNSTNHFSCINFIISYLIWTNNKQLYNDIINLYREYFLNYNFNISLLFDSISLISTQELVLLSNGYEILLGDQYSIDYKNNIYLVIDNVNYNQKQQLILYFFKNFDNKYFDSTINKLILNTINNKNKLYIFTKKNNNKYFYLGSFKVKGIEFDLENKPFFKLLKTIPTIDLMEENYISNQYINIFYEKFSSHQNYELYSNQNEKLSSNDNIDISLDRMNSLLFKYNWVINRFLKSNDIQIAIAYQKFETKLILNMTNVINKNYRIIFENKYVKNWALACDIYKKQYIKELYSIIYIDTKLSITDQNKIIEKALNE